MTPELLRFLANAVEAPHSPASESCNKVARRLRKTADAMAAPLTGLEKEGEGQPLNERLVMGMAGACNCNTKTPVMTHHAPICRARLLNEALSKIENLEDPNGR